MKTILIVEDDRAVASLLRDALTEAGYRVLADQDGEAGLWTFQRNSIDLVIVDILIPKLIGFDLVQELRSTERGRATPVIVVSGVYHAAVHRQQMIDKFGIVDYFDKPVDVRQFLHSVHEALENNALRPPSLAPIRPSQQAFLEEDQTTDELEASHSTPPQDRGAIETTPFARVLGTLAARRARGGLVLQRGGVKKVVYFEEGVPVCVQSNMISECLGRVMVREKMISEKDCEESVRKLKATGERQGAILVNMGSISPQNLMFALERQLGLKLFEIFSWTTGRYIFSEDQKYHGPKLSLPLTPLQLVHEGIARMMSADRVYSDLARIEHKVVARESDPSLRSSVVQVNASAGVLVDAIDGSRTIRGILDACTFDRLAAARILYSLLAVGMIGLLGEGRRSQDAMRSIRERQVEPPPILDSVDTDAPEAREKTPLEMAREKANDAAAAAALKQRSEPVAPPPAPVAPPRLVAVAPEPPKESVAEHFFSAEKRPAEIDPALEETRNRLLRMNLFERLGVPKTAARPAIEAAFAELSVTHHPDRVLAESAPPEHRALAEEVFLLIRRAHDTLTNDAARATYDADPERDEGLAKQVAAERAFKRGLKRTEKAEWKRALRDFQLAVDRNPLEGMYLAHLAWATFSANPEPETSLRALRELELAIERNPVLEEAHLFRGLIEDKVGHRDEAIESYKRALAINPDSLIALAGMGRPRTSSKRGILTRLGITD